MKYDKKTITAIKKSIQHWEKLAAGTPGQEIGPDACPLCCLFNCGERYDCIGCPIADAGYMGCTYSPYEDCEANWSLSLPSEKQSDKFRKAAKREVEFLKEILEQALQ